MANFALAFQPENGINLDDLAGIFAGIEDPTIVGESAPIGSIFLRTNGSLYQKIGQEDTEWIEFSQGIGETVRISSTDSNADFLSTKITVGASLTKQVVNAGSNETLLINLANVGNAGTYTKVTTNSKGQVISGANPTTLSGYGILDAQPLDGTLTALAAFNTNGFLSQTAHDTFAGRIFLGTANQINVTDGDGVAGNPVLSFPESGLTFPGNVGIILPSGNTAQRVSGLGYTRYNTDNNCLEYFNGTDWVSILASTGGTVTSVQINTSSGLTVSGSPITTSGVIEISLADDLTSIEDLSTTGFAVRTATNLWDTRSILGSTDRIAVSNSDGIGGSPIIDISPNYTGQSSISTVGIITSGIWHGSTIGVAYGGTGRSSLGTANQVLGVNTTGTGLEYKSIISGAGISANFSAQQIVISGTGVLSITGTTNQIIASAGTGAVTLSLPQSISTTSVPTFSQVTVARNPATGLEVATKQYVDAHSNGLTWQPAIFANCLISDSVSTPPDSPLIRSSYIVPNNSTGAWAGLTGHLVEWSGDSWTDLGILQDGTRIGIAMEVSSSLATGSFAYKANQILEISGPYPYTYTFITPSDGDAVLVSNPNAFDAYHQYTYIAANSKWIEFAGPVSINVGTGLVQSGNTISVKAVGMPGNYNSVTTNALGQVISGSHINYLTGNQTITLTGDVNGVGSNAIGTTLSLTGVAAGTYKSVTVDTKGRITAATNPSTLAEYGITDAQGLNSFLTALSNATANGILIKNGNNVFLRTIESQSSRIQITNADGTAGDIAIDAIQGNFNLNEIGGILDISKGGTNLTALGNSYQILGVNTAGTGLEYKDIIGGSGISISQSQNLITIDAIYQGTVKSINVTGSPGLTVSGAPITDEGTISLVLGTELQSLNALNTTGFITRTGSGTYAQRLFVSGAATITITNPQGINGNVGFDLSNIGTAGTYTKVVTDTFGRVTSGSMPSTLAGYGILDAQPLHPILTNLSNSVQNGIIVKSSNAVFARTITAGSDKIIVQYGNGVSGNPSIDVGVLNLNTDIADVIVTSPAQGDALIFNGSVWVNGSSSQKLYSENAVQRVSPVAVGDNSIAIGSEATANAHDSYAFGRQSLARHPGIVQANGRFGTQGDAQRGTYILRTSTINGTPGIEFFLNGVNGGERLVLPTDSTWVWEATIVGHRTDDIDRAGFKLKGVICCSGSLNNIVMLGTATKEVLSKTDSTWDVSAEADTLHGSLKLTVKGASGKIIRWTAVVETVEVTN